MALERFIGRTGWDKTRFAISVTLDLIGSATYISYLFGPGATAGEATDVVFAPIQALWILFAYKGWGRVPAALIGGLEELAPGTDGIPTCTLYHVYAMRQKYGEEAAGEVVSPGAP